MGEVWGQIGRQGSRSTRLRDPREAVSRLIADARDMDGLARSIGRGTNVQSHFSGY